MKFVVTATPERHFLTPNRVVKLRDRKSSSEVMSMVGLSEDIGTLVRKSRLRWYGHVMRRDEGVGIRRVLRV
jgi:hypothetical protein